MTLVWVLLTIGLPWLGAGVVWRLGDRRPRALAVTAALAAGAGALAALGLAAWGRSPAPVRLASPAVWGELSFRADGLGVLLAVIAAGVGSLTVVFSAAYLRGQPALGRYYSLMLVFIGAMAGLVLTDSLLLLFLFWELTALCSYALIAFHADDPRAAAAGLKALLLTQLGGTGLLLGALLVQTHTGSYAISGFLSRAAALPPGALAAVAYGGLIAAMAKSAQVPLHTWLPDAMEAPTPVSALIHAATMVNAGVYLLARFYPAFAPVPGWTTAVVAVGVLSALVAGALALTAHDLKRVLAYSTISQLGYLVYALGAGALFAAEFHLLSHAVFKALLFLSAGAVIHTVGTRQLSALGGLGRSMPFVRTAFVTGALALAGVPILNGFWSKELLLEGGLEHGPRWAYAALLAGSGLTALYAARVTARVFGGPAGAARAPGEAPPLMRAVLGGLALLTATTWLAVGPLSAALAAEPLGLGQLVTHVLSAPATYAALAATALGGALWVGRARLAPLRRHTVRLERCLAAGAGFEAPNTWTAGAVRWAAAALARTQTGDLSWNLIGLAGALAAGLLAVLAWSLRW